MAQILALALNPAIDVSSETEVVGTTRKVRTSGESFDPGGGGVNVARAITELKGDVELLYLSGGVTGVLLEGLLDRAGIRRRRIPIAGDTRISFTVFERRSGLEYRFVGSGPLIGAGELEACLQNIRAAEFRYFVASGSLPRGVPADFLATVASVVEKKGGRFVLDSSGPGLKTTLELGSRVFLIKPSLEELEEFVGHPLDEAAARAVAVDLVASGRVEIVAVTMGPAGVIVATSGGVLRFPAMKVEVRSSVGAGDSFLSAMVLALSEGRSVEQATKWGLAAGAAALLRPGTKLCDRDTIARLLAETGQPGGSRSDLSAIA